jgi:hypothetical protein
MRALCAALWRVRCHRGDFGPSLVGVRSVCGSGLPIVVLSHLFFFSCPLSRHDQVSGSPFEFEISMAFFEGEFFDWQEWAENMGVS